MTMIGLGKTPLSFVQTVLSQVEMSTQHADDAGSADKKQKLRSEKLVQFHYALISACEHGNVDVVEYMLDYAFQRGHRVQTYLKGLINKALFKGHGAVVEHLLQRCDHDITFTPSRELFVKAVTCGSARMVTLLLVDVQNSRFVNDSLQYASDPVIIKKLLAAGADARSVSGRTSVFTAACEKLTPDAARLLLEAQASGEGEGFMGTGSGTSPLVMTVNVTCTDDQVKDKVDVINILVSAGVSPNDVVKGQTVLHVCVSAAPETHPLDTLQALLKHDSIACLINARDSHDMTPLMRAVSSRYRQPEIVKALIDAGANVNDMWYEETPLVFLLFQQAHSILGSHVPRRLREIFALLLRGGVDLQAQDRDGMSLLMIFVNGEKNRYGWPDAAGSILASDMLEHLRHG
jgi:ankyrin repeat protein